VSKAAFRLKLTDLADLGVKRNPGSLIFPSITANNRLRLNERLIQW